MVRLTRLYTPQTLVNGETIKLENQASHHLIKVLRAKPGIQLVLFNGDGNDYFATLVSTESRSAVVTIDKFTLALKESPLNITLLQGLSRGDRMDMTLQKSVELGVNTIIPFISERSNYSLKADRISKKMAHWNQIIISACEQSGRATIPKLFEIHKLADAAKLYSDSAKLILSVDATQSLQSLDKPKNDIVLCIGPEGGLTDSEVKVATGNQYINIQFGPRTLRTETAGPAVISAIQTLWGDF